MKPRMWLAIIGIALACLCVGSTARADRWDRYYHWPYSRFGQYYWSPYEYQRVYDGRYRYPAQMRWYPKIKHWRSWITAKKRYYRGYHFHLDQF